MAKQRDNDSGKTLVNVEDVLSIEERVNIHEDTVSRLY